MLSSESTLEKPDVRVCTLADILKKVFAKNIITIDKNGNKVSFEIDIGCSRSIKEYQDMSAHNTQICIIVLCVYSSLTFRALGTLAEICHSPSAPIPSISSTQSRFSLFLSPLLCACRSR